MRLFLNVTILTILSNFINAQNYNLYQQDFIELANLIQTTHLASDSLKKTLSFFNETYLKLLENCNDNDDFEIIAQTYLARLHDGHTSISSGEPYTRKGYYPVRFFAQNGELFLSNYPIEIPEDLIGKKVISINGVSIDTIAERAKQYISFDNVAGFYDWFRFSLRYVSFLQLCNVDVDTVYSIGLENNKENYFIWKRDLNTSIYSVIIGDKVYYPKTKKIKYHKEQMNDLTGWSGKLFEYKILKNYNTCYFKFSECVDIQYLNANDDVLKPFPNWLIKIFWYFRGGNFSKFLGKMFSNIEKSNIDNLIIDLRQNKGGTSILGYQLLDYLTDVEEIKDYSETIVASELLKKNYPEYFNEILADNHIDTNKLQLPFLIVPETESQDAIKKLLRSDDSPYYQEKPKYRFKGNVFVLVGNKTFSSAAMIAVLLSDNNLSKTVGNPISSNPSHYGEVLEFSLKNTGTRGTISCKKFSRPDIEKGSKELSIDYQISNSAYDDHNGIDEELEKLLKIITQK